MSTTPEDSPGLGVESYMLYIQTSRFNVSSENSVSSTRQSISAKERGTTGLTKISHIYILPNNLCLIKCSVILRNYFPRKATNAVNKTEMRINKTTKNEFNLKNNII